MRYRTTFLGLCLVSSLFASHAFAADFGKVALKQVQICPSGQKYGFTALQISSSSSNLPDLYIRVDSSALNVNGNVIAITSSNGTRIPLGQITDSKNGLANCIDYSVTQDPGSVLSLSMSESFLPGFCLSKAGVFPTPEVCKDDTYKLKISGNDASTDVSCVTPRVIKGEFTAGWGTCSPYNDY